MHEHDIHADGYDVSKASHPRPLEGSIALEQRNVAVGGWSGRQGLSEALRREIFDLARAFRSAIERSDRDKLPVTFSNFPKGACGDAALLLGRFRKDRGFGPLDYVLGWRGDHESGSSHAWLQIGDLVIDITADQFTDMDQLVIVQKSSTWHAAFDGQVQNEGDYRVYDAHTVQVLGAAYAWVIARLPDSGLNCADNED